MHACTAFEGQIVISGGYSDVFGKDVLYSVERYSPQFDTSVYLPRMNKPRCQHVMGVVDGRLLVAGGFTLDFNDKLTTVEQYHEAFERWQVLSNVHLKNETWGAAAVAHINIDLISGCP